jgi:signal transduction histidine kinase
MIRPIAITLAFGLCLAVVLAALAWTSLHLLRFDTAQREAQNEAVLEENVRLALWRMDSALAGLVAQESIRPAADYQPVYYLGPGGVSFSPVRGSKAVQSPLTTIDVPYVVAHLQVGNDGRHLSPQLPDDDTGPRAQEIHALARVVRKSKLVDRLPQPANSLVAEDTSLAVDDAREPPAVMQSQQTRGRNEYNRRSQYILNNSIQTQNATQVEPVAVGSAGLSGGMMTPVWLNGRLLLTRRVRLNDKPYLQICWLEWPAIDTWLTGMIRDLLPAARLAAAPMSSDEQITRRLAALPLVLLPGEAATAIGNEWSPLRSSLAVAWVCVALAAVAVAVLLTGVVSLSERRAAFVSAVTHELRTPLTTLRMYAEMLADGMVRDEADRRTYLETLRREAERLGHLVENVLAYARLERGRLIAARELIHVRDVLDHVSDRLASRCRQSDMHLAIDMEDDARDRLVRTDPSSVEQILFNLVDNACKYASNSNDQGIHLSAIASADCVRLRVSDHGPGIAPPMARRLFRPFSKSVEEAARSAAGVGLGLALCRRLARQLGGSLTLERNSSDGACFVLVLPLAD